MCDNGPLRVKPWSHTVPRPPVVPQPRIGCLLTDQGSQTEESEILQVKGVTNILETLTQVSSN